jgi:hypothetical protein
MKSSHAGWFNRLSQRKTFGTKSRELTPNTFQGACPKSSSESPCVIPANGHDQEVTTKHESLSKHLVVIQKAGIQVFQDFLAPGFRLGDEIEGLFRHPLKASTANF